MSRNALFFLMFAVNSLLYSQWPGDLNTSLPVCVEANDQTEPYIISDGSGGAYFLWADMRDGDVDLYAQRVTKEGYIAWEENGIPIHTNRGDLSDHRIITNGNGGAFILWISNYVIYAQQIGPDGSFLWDEPVQPCSRTESQHIYDVAYDNNGGFVLAFISGPSSSWNELVVQRVDGSGNALWTEGGKTVISHSRSRMPKIAATPEGGALIFYVLGWVNFDFFVQIVDNEGNKTLSSDGLNVGPYGSNHAIVPDEQSGAFITWQYGLEVYTNRIGSAGSPLWGENGKVVCSAATEKRNPGIIGDSNKGVYVTWYDAIDVYDDYRDIYGQHFDSSGEKLWPSDGMPILECNQEKRYYYYSLDQDVNNGFIISWETNYSDYPYGEGIVNDSSDHVWIQKVSSSGECLWTGGVNMSPNPFPHNSVSSVSDGEGGIISVWVQFFNGDKDIFTQKMSGVTGIDKSATSPVYAADMKLFPNYPNPFNLGTRITFNVPSPVPVRISVYDINGRLVDMVFNQASFSGKTTVSWDGSGQSTGTYLIELKSGGTRLIRKCLLLK